MTQKDILFQIKTLRDESVLNAFITFNYRVVHPKVLLRSILYAIVFFSFGFASGLSPFGLLCFSIGILLLFVALFRRRISLSMTKKDDSDYINRTEFTYNFYENGGNYLREDKEECSFTNYKKSITSFFSDHDFFYLGINNDDLFILPKDRFTLGSPSDFEAFISKKAKMNSMWIPSGLKGVMYSITNFAKQPVIDTDGWKNLIGFVKKTPKEKQ